MLDRITDYLESLGFIPLILIVLLGIGSISVPLTFLFMSFITPGTDFQIKVTEQCREAYPDLQGVSGGQLRYGIVWCLSFTDDGSTEIRILEKD